jgi:biopolymer transport protein ExbB
MKRTIFSLSLLTLGLSFFSPMLRAQETETEPPAAPALEAPAETPDASVNPLLDKLRGSGKTGIALFIISVIGFSFAFERVFHLRKSLITPSGLAAKADERWQAGDVDGARKLAEENPSVLGKVIVAMADHRNASHGDVSTLSGDLASREMRYHLQRAYPLAVVATISPLLGLFGTVYGMIGAFESVALAGEMGDPSIMAGDISFALITTALGLVIAVPSLAAYHFFRIRTNLLALGLEEQLSHLMSRWFGPDQSREA